MSTPLNKYEQFESDIVALFIDKDEDGNPVNNQVFDIVPLPDNESEFKPQLPKSLVYVAYESSDFSEPDILSHVVQDEKMKFFVEIHAKTRKGDRGTLSIFETIRKKLVGYKMLGFDKLSLVQTTSIVGSGAQHWIYLAYFSTVTRIVDCQTKPDAPLLTDPEFINA